MLATTWQLGPFCHLTGRCGPKLTRKVPPVPLQGTSSSSSSQGLLHKSRTGTPRSKSLGALSRSESPSRCYGADLAQPLGSTSPVTHIQSMNYPGRARTTIHAPYTPKLELTGPPVGVNQADAVHTSIGQSRKHENIQAFMAPFGNSSAAPQVRMTHRKPITRSE